MTVGSELRKLRWEPLVRLVDDPSGIPYIETSDAARLCKRPLVSVCMLAYNHGPFIRQAIEGVLMQRTDFDFELVIGEDCSSDGTREICFEYQKRCPEKVRVLWWHENVTRFGGNGNRVRAHCRGELVAFCEGDDYWTDPEKLRKQVDVLRRHPEVTMCCHRFVTLTEGRFEDWTAERLEDLFRAGKDRTGFLFDRTEFLFPSLLSQTAAVLYRRSAYDSAMFRRIGMAYDWILYYVLLSKGPGYFINEPMSVYRLHTGGLWSTMDRLEQVRWSLSRAVRLYETDPTPDSKRQRDDWIARLRPFCTPYREWYAVRGWLRPRKRIAAFLRCLRRLA